MARKVLTLDCGNTALKVAVCDGTEVSRSFSVPLSEVTAMPAIEVRGITGVSVCSTASPAEDLLRVLPESMRSLPAVILGPDTSLPIGISYATPRTLGADRVAGAVGVAERGAVLLVDAGTAITIDLVADGRFLGGNISPGIDLRFRSLAEHTSRLPLVTASGDRPRFGIDTETAIRCGVVDGVVGEIMLALSKARESVGARQLVITGGDADIIRVALAANGVEAVTDRDVVARGLARIFHYNHANELV